MEAPLDPKAFLDDVAATEFSIHGATGVDKLHAAGILGQGVKVGVVDSGIWYDHPALGGGFGPGFKVAGGWDFVGDVDTISSGKKPDADPNDTPTMGHGTHVAGIVAAVSDNFVGVAPNCTLYAYKVTGRYDGSDLSTMIDAWLRAYDDGMDVITTSLSGNSGWSDNAIGVITSRIAKAGVIMTFSAGNVGDNGPFAGGLDAGAPDDVLAVASVQAAVSPASRYRLTITHDGVSNTTIAGYTPADQEFPPEVKDWPVVALGFDPANPSEACEPYPADTRDLTGAVALVRRGGCNFTVKQKNLQALGAKYVFVYNDDRPIIAPGTTDPGSLLAMITAEAGHAILKVLQAGANVTADFSHPGNMVGLPDKSAGNTPNFFSSWAATFDMHLKPDCAAPGGNIFSTWPENKYMVESGTSMATPYIAGIAALYISALGGRKERGPGFVAEFNQRVIASGLTLPWFDKVNRDEHHLAPPLQMGGGLVNASKVLYAETTVDKTKINLNDTANFQSSHEITVTNHGASAIGYSFVLEPAAGVMVQNPWNRVYQTWGINTFSDLVPTDMVPDVQLPDAFRLGPGESKQVTITFANPENKEWVNATLIPAYSGKVLLRGDNGDQLSLPYMGVACSLYENKKVFKSIYPQVRSGVGWTSIDEKNTFTFNRTKQGADYAMLATGLDWGARELRWDIFDADWTEADWTWPPTKGYLGSTSYYTGDRMANLADPATYNMTAPMPARFVSRNGMYSQGEEKYWWMGEMANGTRIANGNYTMRIAASRPMADLSRNDGWETFVRKFQVLPLE